MAGDELESLTGAGGQWPSVLSKSGLALVQGRPLVENQQIKNKRSLKTIFFTLWIIPTTVTEFSVQGYHKP